MPASDILRHHPAFAGVTANTLPVAGIPFLVPTFDRPIPPLRATIGSTVPQPVTLPAPQSWVGRQALRFSEWAADQNSSGRINLMMWGVSTWPYLSATFSQAALLGLRTVGTYPSVRRAGYSSTEAAVQAGLWTIAGFYCPVERSLPPTEPPNWVRKIQSVGRSAMLLKIRNSYHIES